METIKNLLRPGAKQDDDVMFGTDPAKGKVAGEGSHFPQHGHSDSGVAGLESSTATATSAYPTTAETTQSTSATHPTAGVTGSSATKTVDPVSDVGASSSQQVPIGTAKTTSGDRAFPLSNTGTGVTSQTATEGQSYRDADRTAAGPVPAGLVGTATSTPTTSANTSGVTGSSSIPAGRTVGTSSTSTAPNAVTGTSQYGSNISSQNAQTVVSPKQGAQDHCIDTVHGGSHETQIAPKIDPCYEGVSTVGVPSSLGATTTQPSATTAASTRSTALAPGSAATGISTGTTAGTTAGTTTAAPVVTGTGISSGSEYRTLDPAADKTVQPTSHAGRDALAAGTVGAGAGALASDLHSRKEAEREAKEQAKEQQEITQEHNKDLKHAEKEHAKQEKKLEKEEKKEEKNYEKAVAKEEKQHDKAVAKEEKKIEKEEKKEEKQHEKIVAKEEKKHEKEVAKEQKQLEKEEKKHEKEIAKEQKEHEKEQKKHDKIVAKEEKKHEKELEKEQKKQEKEEKPGLIDRLLHRGDKKDDHAGEAVVAGGATGGAVAAHEHNKLHKDAPAGYAAAPTSGYASQVTGGTGTSALAQGNPNVLPAGATTSAVEPLPAGSIVPGTRYGSGHDEKATSSAAAPLGITHASAAGGTVQTTTPYAAAPTTGYASQVTGGTGTTQLAEGNLDPVTNPRRADEPTLGPTGYASQVTGGTGTTKLAQGTTTTVPTTGMVPAQSGSVAGVSTQTPYVDGPKAGTGKYAEQVTGGTGTTQLAQGQLDGVANPRGSTVEQKAEEALVLR